VAGWLAISVSCVVACADVLEMACSCARLACLLLWFPSHAPLLSPVRAVKYERRRSEIFSLPPLSDKLLSTCQLVVWDFDKTVLRIHSFGDRIRAGEYHCQCCWRGPQAMRYILRCQATA
jgi:hypothetical protein